MSFLFQGGNAKLQQIATSFKTPFTNTDKVLSGILAVVLIVAVIITIVYVKIRVTRNQVSSCNKNTSSMNTLLNALQNANIPSATSQSAIPATPATK